MWASGLDLDADEKRMPLPTGRTRDVRWRVNRRPIGSKRWGVRRTALKPEPQNRPANGAAALPPL
ncbi:MAG TPA: hypothetical protein EYP53_03575 [Candidatus Latescibacteria bacterium]|nr:hypothetical protein [Candidatus Latescibacterota bacterium]